MASLLKSASILPTLNATEPPCSPVSDVDYGQGRGPVAGHPFATGKVAWCAAQPGGVNQLGRPRHRAMGVRQQTTSRPGCGPDGAHTASLAGCFARQRMCPSRRP
jgi:hypothetical protein